MTSASLRFSPKPLPKPFPIAGSGLSIFQKRVSVKRSYGYSVTGVGHTSLSSASIRSGEIIFHGAGRAVWPY
jgi:hypothetical protein